METLLIKVELSDFEFNGATLITPETFRDKKKKQKKPQENQMPPVNYFDYFSPLADSTEIIDRLDKIA